MIKNWTQKFESLRYISQAYHVVHQPVSRGLAVFADAWLSDWLAEISADLPENGSALEVVPWRCAIQIHDFTYFTLLPGGDNRMILRSLVLTQYTSVWRTDRTERHTKVYYTQSLKCTREMQFINILHQKSNTISRVSILTRDIEQLYSPDIW